MFSFDFRFLNVPKKKIDLEKIKEFILDKNTKRIHFETTHSNALVVPAGTSKGKIKLPFSETIGAILEGKIKSLHLFQSKFEDAGYWKGFESLKEFEECALFVEKYNCIVFLRDCLDLSITLSMNFIENEHSEIGELEYQAKFNNSKDAENDLSKILKEWLEELPYYKIADCVCAMPCSNKEVISLPRRMVDKLESFENISENIYWESKTESLKDATTVEKKLEILEASKLKIDSNLKGKSVILIDDLYMSGISMQYVAMKLKESGASRVFGLALVKSRSNTAR